MTKHEQLSVRKLTVVVPEELAEAIADDVFSRLNAAIRDVAEKMGQGERDAIASLMGRALAEGIGIEVVRGSYRDGDVLRWRTTVDLSEEVPSGEIRYRSGIAASPDLRP